MNDGTAGWAELLADLEARKADARSMGGPDRVERHRAKGRLDARQRIQTLLDSGSFSEIGTLVGNAPADGIVVGIGRIDGRPVAVGAEDFTTLGGSIGAGSTAKRYRIADLAGQERMPLIMMLEGAGHRPPQPGETVSSRSPNDLQQQARLSGRVPMIAAVMGPSAGHGALIAPMADFAIMSSHGAIFTAGPPVVAESLGETVTKEELGGPGVAIASGLVHNVAATDEAVLADIRHYLSYFGSSAWEYPPVSADAVDLRRAPVPEILDVIPRDNAKVYDVREVISLVVDDGSFFQVQPDFGSAIVCALAHIDGHPTAIVANQPAVQAGAITVDAADKAARFIMVADSFHLPLVFLSDNPGVLAGTESERAGILRAGARMFAAQTQVTTPKVQVTMRKAYGFGSMAMSMISFDHQTASYAFPGATLGAMGASSSSRATGADSEAAAAIAEAEMQAAYRSASNLGFDELIDPRDLRTVVADALLLGRGRRTEAAQPVTRTAILP